jgi:universal stress protein family protein
VGELFDEEPEPNCDELAKLRRVVPALPGVAVDVEHRLIYAPPTSANVHPADEIVRFASKLDAAAIVIGTHGKSTMSRMLAGSVAKSVINKAPCLVVAVKSPSIV